MTSDADTKAFCARHNINTETIIDDNGTRQLVVDETGMRQLADLAPNPTQAHALLDQMLAQADEEP